MLAKEKRMKATDFLKPGETAIVVFTDGLNLTIEQDGTGTSGNWIMNPSRRPDRIIIYHRHTADKRVANEILIGQYSGITGPVPDDHRRYIMTFTNLKNHGTTEMNWSKFAETGSAPVRYLNAIEERITASRPTVAGEEMQLRERLISTALEWQRRFGVAPAITSALSEYDAAILVGCTEKDYSLFMQDRTAVSKGADFVHDGKRYQVKANRPSGKRGSPVTLVAKARNYDWDYLIWIHYTTAYEICEAWIWEVVKYKSDFHSVARLSPDRMRKGKRLK
jgi:hypothetical protein